MIDWVDQSAEMISTLADLLMTPPAFYIVVLVVVYMITCLFRKLLHC